ncbi:MAG: hypothetical protein QXU98_02865 [Candidatus Parvarchaeota archaeon]
MNTKKIEAKGVINAIGTVTTLGGNVISEEVLSSIKDVSQKFVNMGQLVQIAGDWIARRLGCESAYITNGASGAIVLSVAACLVMKDPLLKYKLPKIDGKIKYVLTLRNQISEFKYLITLSGAKIKELGTYKGLSLGDFEKAVRKWAGRSAAIYYLALDPLPNNLRIEEVVRIGHSYGLPIIVDASAEVPPKENFTKFLKAGADIVIFSGGKAIGSFSDTGIMIGRSDIINIARELGPYNEELVDSKIKVFIGRAFKVSKEGIIATVVALDQFLDMDETSFLNKMNEKCNNILRKISENQFIDAKIISPPWYFPRPTIIPRVEVKFKGGIDLNEVLNRLKNHDPPIYCYTDKGKLYINPQCLKDREEDIITQEILNIITEKHKDD